MRSACCTSSSSPIGVEETRTGYRIVGERVAYETAPDQLRARWTFWNAPR